MGGGYSAPVKKSTVHFDAFEKTLPSMQNKVVLITGCTSGTGFIAACTMARKGAHVGMLNRRSERSQAAYQKVMEAAPGAKVTAIDCDLMDFSSVRDAAAAVRQQFPEGIDVLCNNAGIMADEDKATKDGYDVQMQTNHLSHFLLTKELLPLLQAAAEKSGEARVVNHSSGARKSKLANVLFTLALHDKLQASKSKVKTLCAAPGLASTNLQVTTQASGGMGGAWFTHLLMRMAQSAEDGAMPLLFCVARPEAQSGDFYEPTQGGGNWGPAGRRALERICTDVKARAAAWEESAKAVGGFDL